MLKDTFCIGLNKINLLYDRSSFRASAIVAVNKLVIEQNSEFFNSTETPLYISHVGRSFVKSRPNVAFLHSMSIGSFFAEDISMTVNESATVTVTALQVAYHLGFREVALVGADHSFAQKAPPNTTVVSDGPDQNHFDPNYFGKGVSWQTADLAQSEVGYGVARTYSPRPAAASSTPPPAAT
uniref:DUF115 domain-containing protein n=1 Tax=Phenylobacterium glaciei TaxID=2803784 RepID=A0A974P713_9CAUL|nr:hypothetical protein JKL49_11695 [Phenylobacterium glaciei]